MLSPLLLMKELHLGRSFKPETRARSPYIKNETRGARAKAGLHRPAKCNRRVEAELLAANVLPNHELNQSGLEPH